MSADNTILVLELSNNEYRVKHVQNAEELYFYWNEHTDFSLVPVSIRVFEFFHNSGSISTLQEATNFAYDLYQKYEYIEYGVKFIKLNKTWLEILVEAKNEAVKEMFFLRGKGKYSDVVNRLKTSLSLINNELNTGD